MVAAKSDLEEARSINIERGSSNADELIASIVAAFLAPPAQGAAGGGSKKAEEAGLYFA